MRTICTALLLVCYLGRLDASQIDIDHLAGVHTSVIVLPEVWRGQTFIMGKAGSLDEIVVRAANKTSFGQNTIMRVYKYNGGQLVELGESTQYIPSPGSPTYPEFHFAFQNVHASAGDTMAFLVSAPEMLLGAARNGLPNSESLFFQNGTLTAVGSTTAVVFATLVTPIPECSTALMGAVGIVIIFWTRRLLT